MKSIIAASVMAILTVATATSASADVVYRFNGTSVTGSVVPLSLDIELVLNAPTSKFQLSGEFADTIFPRSVLRGDVDKFVSLTVGNETSTRSGTSALFALFLQFDLAGAVTSTAIGYRGVEYDAIIDGTGQTASGFIGRETSPCTTFAMSCEVDGEWTRTINVPEPMSLALFGVALAGLGVVTRRRKA